MNLIVKLLSKLLIKIGCLDFNKLEGKQIFLYP